MVVDQSREPQKKYPLRCPVCGVSMVGQKSSPDSETYELHRCFSCGAVKYESGEVVEGDDQE